MARHAVIIGLGGTGTYILTLVKKGAAGNKPRGNAGYGQASGF